MTLNEKLSEFLRDRDTWIHSGEIERMAWTYKRAGQQKQAKPGTVGRTLRLLEEKKIIAVKYPRGSAEYHYVPPQHRSKYIPISERGNNVNIIWKTN